MFTGIIEKTAYVKNIRQGKLELELKEVVENIKLGESISVNGICLTVVQKSGNTLVFDFMPETVQKTNIRELKAGDQVNIERSLKAEDRLSGHFVQGHVDTVAKLIKVIPQKDAHLMYFELPKTHLKFLVEKGSIAINGISLTIIDIDKIKNQFSVGIIPHTWELTNLKNLKLGDKVNIETDILAKYVKNFVKNID